MFDRSACAKVRLATDPHDCSRSVFRTDVLDVVCGECYGSAIVAGVAGSVTGVNIDDGPITHAREA
jgi:protein-L-isoaspartate O-methyltransferase